eukprot:UN33817
MGFSERLVYGRQQENNRDLKIVNVLEQVSVGHTIQCLAQLVDLKVYACEIFDNIVKESVKTSNRLASVRSRVEQLKHQVPKVEHMFHKNSPECFYAVAATKTRNVQNVVPCGLFIRRKAPKYIDRRRDKADKAPPLGQL